MVKTAISTCCPVYQRDAESDRTAEWASVRSPRVTKIRVCAGKEREQLAGSGPHNEESLSIANALREADFRERPTHERARAHEGRTTMEHLPVPRRGQHAGVQNAER